MILSDWGDRGFPCWSPQIGGREQSRTHQTEHLPRRFLPLNREIFALQTLRGSLLNYSPDNEPVPGPPKREDNYQETARDNNNNNNDRHPRQSAGVAGLCRIRRRDTARRRRWWRRRERGCDAHPAAIYRRTPDARRYLYSSTAVSRSAATVN